MAGDSLTMFYNKKIIRACQYPKLRDKTVHKEGGMACKIVRFCQTPSKDLTAPCSIAINASNFQNIQQRGFRAHKSPTLQKPEGKKDGL
jgi:hypothetical protein